MNPRVLCLLIMLLMVLPGCSKTPERKPRARPVKVDVAKVQRGDLSKRLHVSGPLRFIANTTVSAEVTAQVKTIRVADGEAVYEGQLLLVFDGIKIKETSIHAASTLQKDQATLEFNKKEYEKNLSLLKSGSVSQTALDEKLSAYHTALAQVQMDHAALAKAMQDLRKTRVKAPITGRISKRYIEPGEWVEEGGKLFKISDYRKIYLEAHLSDLDLAKLDVKKILNEGIDAGLTVDSYPDRSFQGKLSYVEPVAGEARLFEIRIYVDNEDMTLLQGMFGRAVIAHNKLKNVLKVPLVALLESRRGNDLNRVFVVDSENKVLLTSIKIGKTNRIYAEVREGLKEGDVVVTRGKEVLTTGQAVEPNTAVKKADNHSVGTSF